MRVLAINDISCVGKCSLTVALPIISACGVTCDVLPTALLSTHTGGFEGYTFHDLTQEIPAILNHWKTINLQYDFIYSGYLGSIQQIELVKQIKKNLLKKEGKMIVDPVMGDNGHLYANFDLKYVEKMKELCQIADYILPNYTEACFLSDFACDFKNYNAIIEKLSLLCKNPIITGIEKDNLIQVWYKDKEIKNYSKNKTTGFFHGSGDIFSSAFCGCLANGLSLEKSIFLASDYTSSTIEKSATQIKDPRFGLNFEKELLPFLLQIDKEKNNK